MVHKPISIMILPLFLALTGVLILAVLTAIPSNNNHALAEESNTTGFGQPHQQPLANNTGFGQPQQRAAGKQYRSRSSEQQQQQQEEAEQQAAGRQQQQETEPTNNTGFGQEPPTNNTGFGQQRSSHLLTLLDLDRMVAMLDLDSQQQQPTNNTGFGQPEEQPPTNNTGFGQPAAAAAY